MGLERVGVGVELLVGVFVGVEDGVEVGLFVGLLVAVELLTEVGLLLGVEVGLGVGEFVGLFVGVGVGVFVGVELPAEVGVFETVKLKVAVGTPPLGFDGLELLLAQDQANIRANARTQNEKIFFTVSSQPKFRFRGWDYPEAGGKGIVDFGQEVLIAWNGLKGSARWTRCKFRTSKKLFVSRLLNEIIRHSFYRQ